MEITIKVSVGEFLDKVSILYLKRELIKDEAKLIDIQKELNELYQKALIVFLSNERIVYYYNRLIDINRDLWYIVDAVKGLDGKKYSQSEMLQLYSDCFLKTTFRFMIKSKINRLTNSAIVEQKDCANKETKYILISKGSDLLCYNAKINYFITYYDKIVLIVPKNYHSLAKTLFVEPAIKTIEEVPEETTEGIQFLYPDDTYEPIPNFIDRYDVSDTKGKIINYLMGGRLGDMIHSLYVIMCNYKSYGIKGNLIITNNTKHGGDKFLKHPKDIVADIEPILMKMDYLRAIFYDDRDNIDYDINLNLFRHSSLLYTHNWLEMQMGTFNVPLIKEPFLSYSDDYNFSERNGTDKELIQNISNYVLLHRKNTEDRSSPELTNFLKGITKKNECVYIYFGEDINREFGEDVIYLQVKNLEELMYLLTKAKFCISNQTGVLAFAFAMWIPVLCEHNVEKAYMGHEENNPNFFWISKNDRSTNFDRLNEYINV